MELTAQEQREETKWQRWNRLDDIGKLELMATRFTELAELLREMQYRNDDNPLPFNIYVAEYYSEFEDNLTVTKYIDGEIITLKDESLAAIAEVAALLPGKKEKVLDDDGLTVTYTTANGAELKFTCNKEVTCTKRVVGQKWVEPYVPAPREGHYEDIVEYDCDEVVLLHHKKK
jgi:hypothetical protein